MALLNESRLGKESVYPVKYDKSVLFRIPRSDNRELYGIYADKLPFYGLDVWNAYEISFLTDNGLPVSRVMKMVYSAESKYLVESKSLKLYLNSFNMEKFGKSSLFAEEKVRSIIIRDLSELLETDVRINFFSDEDKGVLAFKDLSHNKLTDLFSEEHLESAKFDNFTESPELLKGVRTDEILAYDFRSDLLRSNCPVTNQPDWGDLFVRMTTPYKIDMTSIVAYLVSFRCENHFHEEVAEMIFKRFFDAFEPENLMVAAMYTRRGGIDINPVRVTHLSMIDPAFSDIEKRLGKNLRQ